MEDIDMRSNKETELTAALFLYAVRCLAEGDQPALRSMNFGPREVEALRDMQFRDLGHLDTLRSHCLKVALDRENFWAVIGRLREWRETGEVQKAMIAADASAEMMEELFGTGGREYVRLRRMFMVETVQGRPPEPSEEETRTLWQAWKARTQDRDDGLLQRSEYLPIHEETGISLRTIWSQTRRWADYGTVPLTDDGH
jgi:hypothetical protein